MDYRLVIICLNMLMIIRVLYHNYRAFLVSPEPFRKLRVITIGYAILYFAIFVGYLVTDDAEWVRDASFGITILCWHFIWTLPAKVTLDIAEKLQSSGEVPTEIAGAIELHG